MIVSTVIVATFLSMGIIGLSFVLFRSLTPGILGSVAIFLFLFAGMYSSGFEISNDEYGEIANLCERYPVVKAKTEEFLMTDSMISYAEFSTLMQLAREEEEKQTTKHKTLLLESFAK